MPNGTINAPAPPVPTRVYTSTSKASVSPRTNQVYTIGVCARDKKAQSTPMKEILSRFPSHEFKIIIFGDNLILHEEIEKWPKCDALIAFFSTGFPTEKVTKYVELHNPVLVNDLEKQKLLLDRRDVYRTLIGNGIPVPQHVFVNRDNYEYNPSKSTCPSPIHTDIYLENNNKTRPHSVSLLPNIDNLDIEQDSIQNKITDNHNDIETTKNYETNNVLLQPEEITGLIESDDYIEVNNIRIYKPFVEKPVDGENHNIYIYYPMNAGGGCKRLFRKIGNRSSEYHPNENRVRRQGSYIYEEFLSTQGTDVKVYTVGPNYAHAEARKSPVLDGKVVRDSRGKEIRYPVILSTEEKEIARKVCRSFEQTVCGFDILRVSKGSYVCDVNGWSFVKNSSKYYDDCATLLRKFLLRTLCLINKNIILPNTNPHINNNPNINLKTARSISLDLADEIHEIDPFDDSDSTYDVCDDDTNTEEEELRCVLAVIRHGDRTPKQKMKMMVCHPKFINYYNKRIGLNNNKDLKIKGVSELEELLTISKEMIALYRSKDEEFFKFLKDREINHGEEAADRMKGICTLRDVLERWQLCGINRKVQLKPKKYKKVDKTDLNETGRNKVCKLLLIIKWGGDLTHSGIQQAESLGRRFRHILYPGGNGDGGLLRLHSTYRHDLKIYTSDEGRVQKTAAAFAKGFLELDGDIIPILVSLVLKSKDANSMLDQSGTSAQETILKVKERLHNILHRGDDCENLKNLATSDIIRSVAAALDFVEKPMKKMETVHQLLFSLKNQLQEMVTLKNKKANIDEAKDESNVSLNTTKNDEIKDINNENEIDIMDIDDDQAWEFKKEEEIITNNELENNNVDEWHPCGRETLEMMQERWAKLHRDFYNKKTKTYDLSKIPDIHDCIRYDAMHNSKLKLKGAKELLELSKTLAHALIPQEYGIDTHEKIEIATDMCRSLLKKIRDDLDLARGYNIAVAYRLDPKYARDKYIKSAHRSVRTRLYFTSESHIHTLLNVLRYPACNNVKTPVSTTAAQWIEGIPELCYMTHFVVRIFERFEFPENDPRRFRAEILFSPGATGDPIEEFKSDCPIDVEMLKFISHDSLTCQDFQDYISEAIEYGKKFIQPNSVTEITQKNDSNIPSTVPWSSSIPNSIAGSTNGSVAGSIHEEEISNSSAVHGSINNVDNEFISSSPFLDKFFGTRPSKIE